MRGLTPAPSNTVVAFFFKSFKNIYRQFITFKIDFVERDREEGKKWREKKGREKRGEGNERGERRGKRREQEEKESSQRVEPVYAVFILLHQYDQHNSVFPASKEPKCHRDTYSGVSA